MTVVDDELAARRQRGEEGTADAGTGDAPTGEVEADAEAEPEATPEPKPPRLLQEPLPGDWDSISNEFGGSDPDRSEIRLLGGKMPIDGSYPKGAEFDILVRVRITGTHGQDLEDAYGQKGGTVRRHYARMISVRRVN